MRVVSRRFARVISRTSRIWFALLVAKATPDVRPNKAWWANTGQMLLAAPIMIGIYCKVHYQMSNLSKTVKIIIFHFPKKTVDMTFIIKISDLLFLICPD